MKSAARPSSARPRVPGRPSVKRRRPSLAARVKPFWIVAVLLVAALTSAGVWLANAPCFRVARVGIDVPLASPVAAGTVRAAAAIGRDANVWLLDTRAIRRRLDAIPYVDRASVHRGQFPRPFVEIAITVRRPFACIRSGGRTVTIDATSRVLQNGCAARGGALIDAGTARLPAPGGTAGDAALRSLLADQATLGDAGLALRSLRRDRWGGLEAVDAAGVILRFGSDDDLAQKAALVGPVRAGIGTKRVVRAIDLRAPGTPIVEFR